MYDDYNDYELLNLIAEDSEDANNILFKKYEPLIVSNAKKIIKYLDGTGIELNDVIQEGMIGLNNAIKTFAESKETLFFTYAKTCIKRKMIDLIVACNRQKNQALNNSISFDREGEVDLSYLAKDTDSNPENMLIKAENELELIEYANKELSTIELEVFKLRINGFNYKEIAEILDITSKQVDNSLQRIKNKLKQFV